MQHNIIHLKYGLLCSIMKFVVTLFVYLAGCALYENHLKTKESLYTEYIVCCLAVRLS